MKLLTQLILLLSLGSLSSTVFGQARESFIAIRTHEGKCLVAGTVFDDKSKELIIKKVDSKCSGNIDATKLTVSYLVKSFGYGWEMSFETSIVALNPRTDGLFIFKPLGEGANGFYPTIPDEILNSKIVFVDGSEKVLGELTKGFVLVYLMEDWAGPVRAELPSLVVLDNEFSDFGFHVIGVSTDHDLATTQSLTKFVKAMRIPFSVVRSDSSLFNAFSRISKAEVIPQAFLIKNNKLRGIFIGGGPAISRSITELIKGIVDREINR